jgi:hypothetical protein
MNSLIVNPIARIVNSHRRLYFAGLLAGAALLLGGGTAHAQRDKNCPARMQQAQQDLSQAMRRYGMNSPEAQHERDELQNVAENCGYARGGYGYNDGDRDDRGRDNRSYSNGDRGYNGGYGGGSYGRGNNPAYDIGYRDGQAVGQKDRQHGKAFRPDKNDQYEDADHGYNKQYGDKNQYKSMYRDAFQRGYQDGYGRRY